MIVNFRCDETGKVFNGLRSRKLAHEMQRTALRKLQQLHRAQSLRDLAALPGNRFEVLKGDRVGQYSIRVNDQWRVCFRWTVRGPADVEIVDYH